MEELTDITHFKIEQPESDTNYFNFVIKYITLFLLLFMGLWIGLLQILARTEARTGATYFGDFLGDNLFTFAMIISLAIVGAFVYKGIKNYSLGNVFEIKFDDPNQTLHLKAVKMLTNSVIEKNLDYASIDFDLEKKDHSLFGESNTLIIKDRQKIIFRIKLERTAWHEYEHLKILIQKVSDF